MDNGKTLYNKLSAEKLYTKSYNEFIDQFGTPEGQKELYNALSSQKLYTKSQDEFVSQFWSDKKKIRHNLQKKLFQFLENLFRLRFLSKRVLY